MWCNFKKREIWREYDFYSVDIEEYSISLKIFENIILLKDVPSRMVYELFITNFQQSYTLRIKDGHNDFAFSKKEFKNIFLRPRITTLLTKVREFQYKLLHGAIYTTKENLLKFGFVENNQCSFCKQMVETYNHLFWIVCMLNLVAESDRQMKSSFAKGVRSIFDQIRVTNITTLFAWLEYADQ